MRMAVDNAVLSGNLIVEVDETNLVRSRPFNYIRKIFRRQGALVRLSLVQSFQMYHQRI